MIHLLFANGNLNSELIESLFLFQLAECADLVIEIPSNSGQANAFYRLNYDPPFGSPPPNTTISSRDVGDEIQFSQGLSGTRYNFWLYYTNETHNDWLTWTVSITTGKTGGMNFSLEC